MKFANGYIALPVFISLENRISSQVLALGLIDLLLGMLFIVAYLTATPIRVLGMDISNRSIL